MDDKTRHTDSTYSSQIPPGNQAGDEIGPYRLVERVGAGGMGEVWKAQQVEPVRRTVALKVIRAGMDTHEVIARFEAERQALALMDHPAIARVYDAGTTPLGRPYFAMEYVPGIPIDEFCDQRKLTTKERLELIQRVCEGVQHAHQKAVIHRDLKPGNVLVATVDGRPQPKIIDFGIAKAIAQPLTKRTMVTQVGQVMGTPAYMSPEQAEMTREDVDTRTDVYSLGVLLYQLLAGALPFDPDELQRVGFDAMRRIIREDDPPRPSTRITTRGEPGTSIAARRRTEPRRLRSQLRGDLDWIVMRALEKDRNRRYGSPKELAEDIGRHLRYEPVLAGPPGARYRTAKFVRRHRIAVGAAVAAFVVLVAFAGTMALQAGRIARERNRAEEGFRQAREAVDRYLTTVSETKLLDVPGLEPLRRELLESALSYHQQFLAQRSSDPALLAELSDSYRRVAQIASLLGDRDEAVVAYGEGLQRQRELVAARPDDPRAELVLVQMLAGMGEVLRLTGRIDEAEAMLDESLERLERLLAADPGNRELRFQHALVLTNQAVVMRNAMRVDEAVPVLEQARDLLRAVHAEDPANVNTQDLLALTDLNLGNLYTSTGTGDALAAFESARDRYRALNEAFPRNAVYREQLARCQANVGSALLTWGEVDAALPELQSSCDILADLSRASPEVRSYRAAWARSTLMLSDAQRGGGRNEEALASALLAQELLAELAAQDPDDADVLHSQAKCHSNLGRLYGLRGERRLALNAFEEAVAYLGRLESWSPDVDYNLGCYLSLSIPLVARDPARQSAAERARREEIGAQAVAALERAVAAGMTHVEWYRQDSDLDALRERPDFQAFLTDLERRAHEQPSGE